MRKKFATRNVFGPSVFLLTLVEGFLCPFSSALAQTIANDLFDIDNSQWMSSESYDINQKRRPQEPQAKEIPAVQPQTTENLPEPPLSEAAETENADASALQDFHTPLMPGMNKGLLVRVDSTEEKKIKDFEDFEAKRLSDKNWKTPLEKFSLQANAEQDDENDAPPLKIRKSFLPSPNIAPAPSVQRESSVKKGHEALRRRAQTAPKPIPKSKEDAEACAALESYKKQQLDAIESDRQTLTALQEAIRALGLTKQLKFMTEQGGALSQVATPPTKQSLAPPNDK